MSILTTQCPQCGTQFQVTLAQLQLRKGFVRCVQCAHIFDGYESVVPEPGQGLPPIVQEPMPKPAVIRQRVAPTAATEPFPPNDVAPDATQGIYAERRAPVVQAPERLPEFLENTPPRAWVERVWTLAAVLALLCLLAQATLVYRVQIASQFPTTRPWLTRLCALWDCHVPYPRKLGQIAILSSALRMQPRTEANNTDTSQFVLHLTLRNQDEHAQQWPSLLLDLTDFSGAVVIRKHLNANDYLPAQWVDQPFAGKSELALRLPIVVQQVSINGYQIRPFFP